MNEQNCGCFGGKFIDFFMGVFQYPVLTSGCNSTYEWILGAMGKSYGLPLVCFLRLYSSIAGSVYTCHSNPSVSYR